MTVINLQLTPTLTHWLPRIAACADPIPDLGVYTQVLAQKELSLKEADLILRLGEPSESDLYTAVMGIEEIIVIAGDEVPLSSLSIESLRKVFAGVVDNWGAIPEVSETGIGFNQTIQVFSYPEGHELRNFFQEAYLVTEKLTSDVQLFFTPDSLEDLIKNTPYGIGYLLKSQLPGGFKAITITSTDPVSTQLYVLAVTSQEPTDALNQLLLCLQDAQ